MRREEDRIIFESRTEVDQLEMILREWRSEHPSDDGASLAEAIAHQLQILWYEW